MPQALPAQVGQLAGFGARLGAFIVDWLIIAVPWFIGFMVLVAILPRGDLEACTIGGQPGICEPLTGASTGILALFGLGYAGFFIFYWLGKLIGETGLTPGRKAANIKVVDKLTGAPIGMGRGIGRGLFAGIISSICFIGYLWMLWDKDKQTLHDKVSNAVVIRT